MLHVLLALPQGVQVMSADFPGLVQTSLNLGVITAGDDGLHFSFSIRSSVATQKEMLLQRVKAIVEYAGGSVSTRGDYPAWQYARQSPLRDTVMAAYKDITGQDGVIMATHGGLECGLLINKMPGLGRRVPRPGAARHPLSPGAAGRGLHGADVRAGVRGTKKLPVIPAITEKNIPRLRGIFFAYHASAAGRLRGRNRHRSSCTSASMSQQARRAAGKVQPHVLHLRPAPGEDLNRLIRQRRQQQEKQAVHHALQPHSEGCRRQQQQQRAQHGELRKVRQLAHQMVGDAALSHQPLQQGLQQLPHPAAFHGGLHGAVQRVAPDKGQRRQNGQQQQRRTDALSVQILPPPPAQA